MSAAEGTLNRPESPERPDPEAPFDEVVSPHAGQGNPVTSRKPQGGKPSFSCVP